MAVHSEVITAEKHPWRQVSRDEIDQFVRSLSHSYEVVGVQEKRGRLLLEQIEDPTLLRLEFPPKVHSPKKYLFPNWDKLFRFRMAGPVLLEPEQAAQPRVLFGVHPCDIHAIRVLDDCLFEGEVDSTYKAKREVTLIVGVDCVPDADCFCTSMGTDRVQSGFDLFLHRAAEGYLLQGGTRRGWDLVVRHAPGVAGREPARPLALQAKEAQKKLQFPAATLPSVLADSYDHPIWGQVGEECLGCGICSLVCPTCYCFNVKDKLDLNLASGDRVRVWDSCQLDNFTQVAGGMEFRTSQADRQRHRFYRKYKYLWEQRQRLACVGCGRCIRECLQHIDPVEVLNKLHHERAFPEAVGQPGQEYRPLQAEVLAVETLTPQDKLFRLRLPKPIDFTPGMFLQLSIFGLGEAPFTIASPADHSLYVEIVVRAAGSLTRALHRLKTGDVIGVRGPFGQGFPLEQFRGQDVLLVAGGRGLITLRSLLLTILAERHQFGRVQLLYGAHDDAVLLFRDDLERWQQSTDMDCRYIIQQAVGDWYGLVGDITLLLRDLDLAAGRTCVAVSGPAGMYRFTNPLLFRMGFREEQLFLNLERHMKCGLGKCGRCQINDVRVCECGPIFSYDRVRHLREAIER